MFYFLFWISFGLLALGSVLYPLVLWAWARGRARTIRRDPTYQPHLTFILPFRNDEDFISRKINNLLALPYPAGRLELVLVSDGSADRSDVIADLFLPHPQIQFISLPQRGNLARAWNAGAAAATGEVLVFTDARQLVSPETLAALVSNLSDPAIGGVTGGRQEKTEKEGRSGRKLGRVRLKHLIRQIRYFVKTWENRIHSVTEVNEALFAQRKSLYQPVSEDTWLPGTSQLLTLVNRGFRVVFEPEALLIDTAKLPLRVEVERYRRIFAGYFQLLLQRKVALPAFTSPVWWQLLLHNWLRLVFPFLLFLLFVSNLFIADSLFYNFTLLGQLLLIGIGLLSIVFTKPLLFYLFSRFNFLVVQGFYQFLLRVMGRGN